MKKLLYLVNALVVLGNIKNNRGLRRVFDERSVTLVRLYDQEIGAAAEGIFSLFHPLGAPSPPLWIAQVLSMAIAGAAGGLFFGSASPLTPSKAIRIGIAGFLCTLNFAVLTTLAYSLTVSFSMKQILASLVFGVGFYVLHLTSNTVIFFTVVPAVLKIQTARAVSAEPLLQGKPR